MRLFLWDVSAPPLDASDSASSPEITLAQTADIDSLARRLYTYTHIVSVLIICTRSINREKRSMDFLVCDNQGRLNYWLFYAQRCVAYAYAEVLRAHCEERGKPYVITPPQWGALLLLREQDGMTIGLMGQQRGLDAPTVTGIIKRLEQHGLVERRHNRDDRRLVKVYLTDEGRDIMHTLAAPVEQFEQRMKQGFSEDEVDRLLANLQQLIVNVSEVGPGLGDRFGLLPKEQANDEAATG